MLNLYPTTFPTAQAALVGLALNRGSASGAEEIEAAWYVQGWILSQLTAPPAAQAEAPRLSMTHCAVMLQDLTRRGPDKPLAAVDWVALLTVLNRIIGLWLNSGGA